MDLLRRNALFRGIHHEDDLQPGPQGQVGGLKNRPHPNREWFAARVALIQPWPGRFAFQLADPVRLAAMVTDRTGWPQLAFHIREGRVLILEVFDGKLRSHGTDPSSTMLGR